MGLLGKTGKVLYASAEVVLGGVATVGGVVTVIGSGGLGSVLGGGVAVHGANSVGNGFRDFGHVIDGEWEQVGSENYLKDNVYEPAGGFIGREVGDFFYDNPEQGEVYGEMAGAGVYYAVDIALSAKGTKDAVKLLNKAQWTRGVIKPTNTPVAMEECVGYKMDSELTTNIVRDMVGYYYNLKSAGYEAVEGVKYYEGHR